MKEQTKMSVKIKKQADKELVRKFYKDFFTWKADNVGTWVACGIVECIYVLMMLVPFEEMMTEKGMLGFVLLVGVFGPYTYLIPYTSFSEEGKRCRIYEKLKYLPVEKSIIQQVRVEQLVKFALKMFPVIAVVQLGMSLIVEHHLTIWNFAYVLWFGFLWPVLINLPAAWTEKS